MFDFLKQPYPCHTDLSKHMKTAAGVSLFIIFFLVIFKPFGLNRIEAPGANLLIAGYGVVCFITLVAIYFMTKFIRRESVIEEKWTTGKEIMEILMYVFFIGIGNWFYTHFVFGLELTVRSLVSFEIITMLVAVFPVTVMVLINQARLMKKNTARAEQINQKITSHAVHSNPIDPQVEIPGTVQIAIISENEKDVLTLNRHELIMIEASDNYVTVYYLENEKLKSKLIRSSLKRIESQVKHHSLIRCHRTYMINLEHVQSVSGNAQGLRLRFAYFNQLIPVSRNHIDRIRSKLSSGNS